MTKQPTVKISEAKGRPMLHWVGKRPLDHVTAYPAQQVEVFNPTGEDLLAPGADAASTGGLLFHGDNKDVLAWLLAHGYRGKVDLVYIDPPYDSGADYVRRITLRGKTRSRRIDGEVYSLGEQIQYTDIWTNDTYLQFIYERLLLIRELMSTTASIWVHCDYHRNYYIRCMLDEVFGPEGFVNEVVWRRKGGSALSGMSRMSAATDTLYLYSKGSDYVFNRVSMDPDPEYVDTMFTREDPDGRRYMVTVISSPTYRPNLIYDFKGYKTPPKGWRYSRERMEELDVQGLLYYPDDKSKQIYKKIYLDEYEGQVVNSLWSDISLLKGSNSELLSFPTQKPEELVERIIRISSSPKALVLDCFIGSGTTAAVAQKLGRRWIASDINKGAIQTTSKRLQSIIREQIEAGATPHQPTLGLTDAGDDAAPPPASLAFSVYRVNDYDLQLQHNEAVNLVVEHVGIDRTRTDRYFDGTLGKRLVKIVPFNHPLTLLDLQEIQDALATRRDDERDVTVVCLGKETAVDPWLADYNRRHPINRIDVIELRTDEKYGEFLVHEPAQADVAIRRAGDEIVVEIEDFLSPTIVNRLEMDTPLFKARIPDWRAMVDVVLIDTAYDEVAGVFDIDLSDVPERKDDLVQGAYRLPAPEEPTTVAVKIIDMLGEEVLVTKVV